MRPCRGCAGAVMGGRVFLKKHQTMQSVASCQTARCQGDGRKHRWTAAHELQRGHALYDVHGLPFVIAHATIAWRDLIKSECLLLDLSQRRVADAAHRAADARSFKNLSANGFANR